jgi:hypothetical protein
MTGSAVDGPDVGDGAGSVLALNRILCVMTISF